MKTVRVALRRVSSLRALITVVALVACAAIGHAQSDPPYTTVFYTSGALRIEAYLYKPSGEGPFPAVVYNHGNRGGGRERAEEPQATISALLTDAGFVVFVPERRGFGRSEGPTFADDGTADPNGAISRVERETDDVLAALDYLKTRPFIDMGPPGHLLFTSEGIPIWGKDTVAFLAKFLRPKT